MTTKALLTEIDDIKLILVETAFAENKSDLGLVLESAVYTLERCKGELKCDKIFANTAHKIAHDRVIELEAQLSRWLDD